jgi:hypothetical protein
MNKFEALGLAALTAASVAGAETPKGTEAGVNEGAKTQNVSQHHGESATMQLDKDGRYFMVVNGKKQYFESTISEAKASMPKIESKADYIPIRGADESEKIVTVADGETEK